jgi:hypothetical protein
MECQAGSNGSDPRPEGSTVLSKAAVRSAFGRTSSGALANPIRMIIHVSMSDL